MHLKWQIYIPSLCCSCVVEREQVVYQIYLPLAQNRPHYFFYLGLDEVLDRCCVLQNTLKADVNKNAEVRR